MSASAHIFVDDKQIIECIPLLTGTPEKAWHVLYSVETDNRLFGFNANDAAAGVEYCYGKQINADEAYSRYVWVIAYICFRYNIDVKTAITGHFFLDPERKSDPVTGLANSRRTWEQLLRDIATEYDECSGKLLPIPTNVVLQDGKVRATTKINIRASKPDTRSPVRTIVLPGTILSYNGFVTDGQSINGNSKWYSDQDGNFFWSGGVESVS
jgi:N-acetylmuramoyl-L-alanine amidase CwlA